MQPRKKANVWLILLGILAYGAITAAFAWQTYEFVSWLMPSDDWLMKSVAMFSFDGCALGYAIFDMFWPFHLRAAKETVRNMWVFTLGCSTLASVIQMYLASTHLIPHTVDSAIIYISYAIVVVVFVVNMVSIYRVFRLEYVARHPDPIAYLDDYEVQPAPTRVSLADTSPMPAIMPPAPQQEHNDGIVGLGKRILFGDQDLPAQPAQQQSNGTSVPVEQKPPTQGVPLTKKQEFMKEANEASYQEFLAWKQAQQPPLSEAPLDPQQPNQ